VVIFVGALSCGCDEGDLVIGRDIGNALLQERGEIVIELESQTAALNGEHLESQIAKIDLAGFADTFEKLLVVGAAKDRLSGADRIDVVNGDPRLSELSGETYNLREDVPLLLGVEFDIGAGKQRPAGRDPDEDFTLLMRLANGKLTQRLERILQAFGCAIETGGASDITETDLIAIHGGAEGVAVAREILSNLNACIRDDSNRDGVCEAASFGMEELVDLNSLVGDGLGVGIDRVNYQDDLGGNLATGDGLERSDGLRRIVVQHGEILLLETGDGRAGFRGDDDVEVDVATCRLSLRAGLLG